MKFYPKKIDKVKCVTWSLYFKLKSIVGGGQLEGNSEIYQLETKLTTIFTVKILSKSVKSFSA